MSILFQAVAVTRIRGTYVWIRGPQVPVGPLGTRDGKEATMNVCYTKKGIMPIVCVCTPALAASHLPVGCGQSMAKAGSPGVE
jgi:hypothetical protein